LKITLLKGDAVMDNDAEKTPIDGDGFIEVTLINSDDPLTKTFAVSNDGVPRTSDSPFLSSGTAHRVRIPTADFPAEFALLLTSLHSHSCLVLGALSAEVNGDDAHITTKDRHEPRVAGTGSPLIWRGKDWLGYRTGKPAAVGLDHDAKDLPDRLQERMEAQGGLLSVLGSVCPELLETARVARPSVSTGIVASETGLTSVGGGWHIYVLIHDGSDAKGFIERLHNRLLLAGWGFPFVSESGAVQVRSLLDTAASGVGERLWFEASAMLVAGLRHTADARDPEAVAGRLLNTKNALAPLTTDEVSRLGQIKSGLCASVATEATENRRLHTERIRDGLKQRGEDAASTKDVMARLLDADERGVLTGRHVLHLDDGRVVSITDVLADRASYHRVTCADPLEPNYGGGRNKAVIYTDGVRARLYTHAHGGRIYGLAFDEVDIAAAINAANGDGGDPARVAKKLAPDTMFASGGWLEVESATGWRPADTSDLNHLEIGTREKTRLLVGMPIEAGDLVPVPSGTNGDVPLALEPLDDDAATDLLMRHYNERFAVVAEGGSTSVVRLAYNAELERWTPVSMTLDAFRLLYGNQYLAVPQQTRNGIVCKDVPATDVWLKHPARRTCTDGFGLDPTGKLPSTCFNLWQGFGVEEREGDWSKLRNMIHDVLAAGNYDHFEYIIHWLAHLVQRPAESPGVALVFRGEEGTGKGTLGRAIMRMIRPHAMQITHSKHLTGHFNAHMRTVLFLFADEAFFAGDRANEGALKGLITESYRVNEGKGRDATLGRNRLHLMMASNNTWVVPASAEARRYAVFDVSPIHKQDAAYFGAILAEMDVDGGGAGIAAMLYDLRRIALNDDLVRKTPETAGLHSQRIASLRGVSGWLFDALMRGYIGDTDSQPWREHYSTEELFESYRAWSAVTREAFAADRHAVGKILATMFATYRPRKSEGGTTTRPPGYRFGTLAQARNIFAERQGIGSPWPDDDAAT
jgi:hypothetical protein